MAAKACSTEARLHAVDQLNARLDDMSGVLSALMANYTMQTVDEMEHPLTASSMLDTLGAMRFLLSEAHDAADILSGPRA